MESVNIELTKYLDKTHFSGYNDGYDECPNGGNSDDSESSV
jgi:hypothetical protein